jgi:hypothetical protein
MFECSILKRIFICSKKCLTKVLKIKPSEVKRSGNILKLYFLNYKVKLREVVVNV